MLNHGSSLKDDSSKKGKDQINYPRKPFDVSELGNPERKVLTKCRPGGPSAKSWGRNFDVQWKCGIGIDKNMASKWLKEAVHCSLKIKEKYTEDSEWKD